jgi:DNA polymerase-3 subunit beta
MKIECIKDKLVEALSKIERIANRNSHLPILSCVLLIARDTTLTLKVTNLEVGVEVSIPVKVLTEGTLAIPAGIFFTALHNIKSQKITIEEKGELVNCVSEKTSISLKKSEPQEFPLIPRINDVEKRELPIKEFINGLKSVVFSASISSIKPELGSVYIYQKDGHIYFVATDSFRLAEKRIISKKEYLPHPILIPLKNTNELIKVFDGFGGDVSFIATKNQISIENDQIYFTSRAVDGVFPDYEQIIPKEPVTTITTIKQDFADGLKTTSVVLDKFNQLIVSVSKDKQQISLQTKNSEVGEGVISIPSKIIGDDISMSFSQKYLSDVMGVIDDESITAKFGGVHKPLLIEGAVNKSFRYLVMPMNR